MMQKSTRRAFFRTMAAGAVGALVGGWGVERLLTGWHATQYNAPALPLTGRSVEPLTVTTAGGITLHAIQTGYVAVKTAHRQYSGADGTGVLAIAADPHWTGWMPIHTWVIEHPEGVIVVDTGETAQINTPGYVDCDPVTGMIYRSFLRFAVTPEDEIASQLADLGIRPDSVRWVVQTHLHSDHAGGLSVFPSSEYLLSSIDYPQQLGALMCHYPTDFNPTLITFTGERLPGFERSHAVTRAGDVWIVPTPGHTAGHQSVIFHDGQKAYCLAGDTSFDDAQLLSGATAGIATNPAAARASLAALRTFAADTPLVYLPSHDPNARQRLIDGTTVSV
jgi:glyoxylase-like metal-dependent hydrolase (beta-lactamase superfamily II)